MSELSLRRAERRDVPFITNSWLKSHRRSPAVIGVPDTIYYANHHGLLERLLPDPGMEVWIACNAEDHDQILGWICAYPASDGLVVHYAYVKSMFRKLGIARMLLDHVRTRFPSERVFYTHRTRAFSIKNPDGPSLRDTVDGEGFVFHPYLLDASLDTQPEPS